MKHLFPLMLAVASTLVYSQTPSLNIIVPETDTVTFALSRYRIAGNTLPGTRVFIDHKEVNVYSDGAFVGMHYLTSDTTLLHVVAVDSSGKDSVIKNIVFMKPVPPPLPEDEIYIARVVQPSDDQWLTAGDILEVSMKGTPGQHPKFDIDGVESGIPMTEVDPKQAGGATGLYVGRYIVEKEDECTSVPVMVYIKKNIFSSVKAYSAGKISMINDSLPRVAEVIGRNPYFNAGLGTDRLGGAKLGFIVDGVRVVVTGKVGDQYKVQLSNDMEAWLPEKFTQLLPADTPLPNALTGTISVAGNDSEDIVRMAISQHVPYLSEQLTDPTAIAVHVFNASSNTNWITHLLSAEGIKQVKCLQTGTDEYTLTIYLNYQQHWGYDISYDGNAMLVRVRRPPVVADTSSPLKNLVIGIDAGHGGTNQGAIGCMGIREKVVSLQIARDLDSMLQGMGVRTVMTRDTDESVGMMDRGDTLAQNNVNILVSIHCNSIGETSDAEQVQGTSTYYRYPGFKPLADIMYSKMLELGLGERGVTGNFNFSLSGPTQFPNVLVETAFLSNPEDEMKLLDPAFQKKIAAKITEGLKEFVLQR